MRFILFITAISLFPLSAFSQAPQESAPQPPTSFSEIRPLQPLPEITPPEGPPSFSIKRPSPIIIPYARDETGRTEKDDLQWTIMQMSFGI